MTPTRDIKHKDGALEALADFDHRYKKRLRPRRPPAARRRSKRQNLIEASRETEFLDAGPLFAAAKGTS